MRPMTPDPAELAAWTAANDRARREYQAHPSSRFTTSVRGCLCAWCVRARERSRAAMTALRARAKEPPCSP